jgi:hypothetical protein
MTLSGASPRPEERQLSPLQPEIYSLASSTTRCIAVKADNPNLPHFGRQPGKQSFDSCRETVHPVDVQIKNERSAESKITGFNWFQFYM